MTPDLINGLFEAVGGASVWMHAFAALRAKQIKGVSLWAVIFMTLWGFWNLFYYPHLRQWWSFAGGLVIVTGNIAWLYAMRKYWSAK